ncbi:MAG TPA: type III-B CRISPR module RAMP protein Cmr4 [Sulfurihydrogenibium sp.]|uniref:type III-B CRISPR module RAMP protein Cmr4 n=1 Tax=Sulfurihydrogenibium sp. (strain YO3AOP1) TaxID=436114 RepID=UPI000172326F|nr:type III-B CRISPR module RAMP protein Cmr4 [Sulfurihydrogenibium sp. YO3AOP1]ACD66296.1 CRISPR-associated RAMP protein, Cmr4 family [Sulfurihydrogenibium sp. YO3AOP1]HBT98479.1 type III-B CRISPR module RAMP protein Cmr4 [Sulfurihydrogenibium sp.]
MKKVFYHVLTPMHIGSGTTLSLIDLPIQREAHTDFPVMPSSAIKGVIRASFNEQEQEDIFGKGDEEGKVIFTDGKILLFPVKSLKGVFVWITSPYVLERFKRDTEINVEIPKVEKDNAVVSSNKVLMNNNKLVLEEFTFNATINENLKKLKEITKCEIDEDKIAVVSDDVFKFFVKNYTEVNARIKIDQTKGTVDKGGLWYEELLPAETVFYGCIDARKKSEHEEQLNKVIEKINNQILQFGGDETLGRGFTKIVMEA